MFSELAYFKGGTHAGEHQNIELAKRLCESEDKAVIQEIVEGLADKNSAIASDCIKVLYEIGERKPILIVPYAEDFLRLLHSKNNRLVWGGMTALATIAEYKADLLFKNLEAIMEAYRKGSVITIDHTMTVLAQICKSKHEYEKVIFPILMNHLETCHIKEIPQHAERITICVNDGNKRQLLDLLNRKKESFTEPQQKRINKIVKSLI